MFTRPEKWSLTERILDAQRIAEQALKMALELSDSRVGRLNGSLLKIKHMDIKARPQINHGEDFTRKVMVSIQYTTISTWGAYHCNCIAKVLVELSGTNGEVDHSTSAHVRLFEGDSPTTHSEIVSVTGITGNTLAYLVYDSRRCEGNIVKWFSW